ncbi:MAG: HAMP domain-containing histidine kinase [Sphingobacteriaceae bacterium]|nr:HAMP domain-containing histidine kinase [Sphingobacteriaceae bacterium]
MAIALLGVLAMQWYFLNQSYQLKSQLFDQNVNEALSNVAKKLERQEAYNFLLKKAVNTKNESQKLKNRATQLKQNSAARKESYAQFLSKEQQKADSLFTIRDSMLRARYPLVLAYDATKDQAAEEDELQQELVQFVDPFGGIHQQVLQQRVPKLSVTKQNPVDSIRQYIVFDPQNGPKLITLAKPRLSNISRNNTTNSPDVNLVQQYLDSVQENKKNALQDLAQEFGSAKMPLNKRIQAHMVDQLLRKELKNKGITGSFTYQIQQGNAKNKLGTQPETTEHLHTDEVYKTQLFPKEMIKESGWLLLSLPNKSNYILANMTWIMALSGGLLLILLGSFGYTLQLILRQKKISEMKTDFINNMTHEFKTPVATIMIASEALKDEELSGGRAQVERLATIIYDENIRLGNHIERVLHLAKVDKEDFKLENRPTELNTLIAAVADSMSLQLEKQKASIELDLQAKNDVVFADELHLSNVVFNLIDNAIKYCNGEAKIKISTQNLGKQVLCTVQDNGLGMSKDQIDKIFDQFYRIPTGNVHNVKGFGLGLSYVNTIVRLLKGQIKVKSEKHKGSTFEISIPLA